MVTEIKKESKQLLVNKINSLKKEKRAVILAHNYQIPDIQDIADFIGDSLELARLSKNLEAEMIVFCGVRFMAETAKILSPSKKVILPVENAGCPLADMIEPQDLEELKAKYPQAWVVSYVNTSAQVKALSDICCTSSNAIKVVRNVPTQEVIFTPDKNLGWWVSRNVPEKKIIIWEGYCVVHQQFLLSDLERARSLYPQAEIIVHPECPPSLLEQADFVLSTSGMLKRAKESEAKQFIIGTEEGLIHRLKRENPNKEFYSLGPPRMCVNMKKITLFELYNALDKEIFEIRLEDEVIIKARKSLERMVEYV